MPLPAVRQVCVFVVKKKFLAIVFEFRIVKFGYRLLLPNATLEPLGHEVTKKHKGLVKLSAFAPLWFKKMFLSMVWVADRWIWLFNAFTPDIKHTKCTSRNVIFILLGKNYTNVITHGRVVKGHLIVAYFYLRTFSNFLTC